MPKLWTALFGTLAFLWLVETVRLLWGMADLPRLGDVAPLPDNSFAHAKPRRRLTAGGPEPSMGLAKVSLHR
jgi:hypothetical protein